MLDGRRTEKKNCIRGPVGDLPKVSLIDSGWPQCAICGNFCHHRSVPLQRKWQIRICPIAPRQEYLRSLKPLSQLRRQPRTSVRLRHIFDTKSGLLGRFSAHWTNTSNLQLAGRSNQVQLQLLAALYYYANRLCAGKNHPIKLLHLREGRIQRREIFRLCERHQRKRSEERRVGKECRSRWSPYH